MHSIRVTSIACVFIGALSDNHAPLNQGGPLSPPYFRDRKGTPKNFCDKDFAELSGERSGAICLKTFVLLGSAPELSENSLVFFVRFFGFGVLLNFWPLINSGGGKAHGSAGKGTSLQEKEVLCRPVHV